MPEDDPRGYPNLQKPPTRVTHAWHGLWWRLLIDNKRQGRRAYQAVNAARQTLRHARR